MSEAKTVLILGGGWGGLTAAHHLRDLLPPNHRILVIERSATFSLGVSNLGLMTGTRQSVDQIRRNMARQRQTPEHSLGTTSYWRSAQSSCQSPS